jgi:predicted unusual protein kinase regulating ubiquinone biosynthesis (AarF/ABC1/UbiB family)
MSSPPKGKLGRLARLSSLTGRVTSSYVGRRVAGVFQDADARQRALERLHLRNAEQIVDTMGHLKGAAMKVGQQFAQLASTIELPPEVQGVLGKLHDDVEPVPWGVVERSMRASLDVPLDSIFADINPEPLGTASLGQAHAAQLKTGEDVVVKVLHDGIEATVGADLGALKALLVTGRVLRRDRSEIDAVFAEIRARLDEELDYLHEAANMGRFGELFRDEPRLRIPSVHPHASSERVLTMERLPGVSLPEFIATADRAARQKAGEMLAELYYRSAFQHRFLHGDPHPGNFLFEPDGTVGLIDFGCVKRLDEYFMADYARCAIAAVDGRRGDALAASKKTGAWQGDDPKAGRKLWRFCEALAHPYRQDEYTLGGPDDDVIKSVSEATAPLLLYPEIRAPAKMLYLHRTLGGSYTIARELVVTLDLGGLLRKYGGMAIANAEGRAPSVS